MEAVPTDYQDVRFRSRLEASFAHFCDNLKIKWQFEPKRFVLNVPRVRTSYLPDFFLPEIKTWVECKGDHEIEEYIDSIGRSFGKELLGGKKVALGGVTPTVQQLLVISYNRSYLFDNLWASREMVLEDNVWVVKCYRCKRISFTALAGTHDCKACGYYPGDLGHWGWKLEFSGEWEKCLERILIEKPFRI